jgi:DNA-binding HxlR family transcriptional regulator
MGAVYIADQLELSARGISSNTLSRVLKEMTDEGVLTKTGERRATRYSVAKP